MSAHSHSPLPENRDLLGELLHSVSQPLTTLRCSLELSLDEGAEQQLQTITTAMEQTENVIAMIQLMREYLDAEPRETEGPLIALMPVLTSVVNDLSTWAALGEVRIRITRTCPAELPIKLPWVRKALEYLLSAMIERQPAGSEITVGTSESPSGVLLRVEGEQGFGIPLNLSRKRDSVAATIRRVRLAIAARVLEGAGVTLSCDDGDSALVLRIPLAGRPTV